MYQLWKKIQNEAALCSDCKILLNVTKRQEIKQKNSKKIDEINDPAMIRMQIAEAQSNGLVEPLPPVPLEEVKTPNQQAKDNQTSTNLSFISLILLVFSFIIGILTSFFPLPNVIGFGLMIIARVKDPTNKFSKVVMWINIIYIIIQIIIFIIFFLLFLDALKECSTMG